MTTTSPRAGAPARTRARTLHDETRQLLARALRPFILRRTKARVAPELPEKIEQTLECELGRDERRHYDELRNHYRVALMQRVERDGMAKSTVHVLEALLRLRHGAGRFAATGRVVSTVRR